MKRNLSYQITKEEEGMTILNYLKKQGFSRHILTGFKTKPGSLLMGNKKPSGNQILKEGDILTICLQDEENATQILPVPGNFSILYEDEDLLVVNKPSNMPIHPSQGNYENTLANAVTWYYQEKGETLVYRCINRLDRDTTGALILAKNALSAAILSQQMKERKISRTYLALVQGIPPLKGTICAPIGRVLGSTIERQIDFENGEHAVTHYERLETFSNNISLLELHLETGRTHQIRVHMKHAGYPLLGDHLYYPDYRFIQRQALHSYQIEFVHPIQKIPMCFQAPLPQDMITSITSCSYYK